MALTRKKKVELLAEYEALLKNTENIVALWYSNITVSESVFMRKQFKSQWALYKVVKKNIFAIAVKNTGYEVDLSNLPLSISVLFLEGEGVENLKVIEDLKKKWKKAKSTSRMDYLGWWFSWEWKDMEYVSTLAKLPSKEELVSKFLYMVKYPIQGFVTANSNVIWNFVKVLDQIAKKD